jgi:hypothetical protein
MARILMAAFDQGQVPTISCVNRATADLGVGLDDLVAAMQTFVDQHFAPIWGTPCKLVRTAGDIPADNWGMVFLDNADVAQALGYHDLTEGGLPLAKIFVQTTIDDGEEVSVTAAHELAEMLVDPGIQMGAYGPDDVWYAYETADAVERETFAVNGINMSDFVYPAWFEAFRKPGSTRFDHLNKCNKPFQILKGGYMPVYHNGKWSQVFGSKGAEKWFKRRHHPRTERRTHGNVLKPVRSRPKKLKQGKAPVPAV